MKFIRKSPVIGFGRSTPRLATPRTKIPAGSVGIAGKQTGVYPIDSPGGWQLIGRTPLCLFDPQRDPAVLITAGDFVRFVQIDESTYQQLAEQVQRGEIYWSANGNPRRKVYFDENPGLSVQDIWLDFKDAHNQNIEITGYPTEKNPELLKRIIQASSNPGDLVLDCFAGSGTTLAVADLLGRSWIGIDKSSTAIQTTLQRFFKGTQPMGDFVSQEDNGKPARPSNTTEQELLLFDFYQMNAAAASVTQPKQHHQPITDFGLYSQVSLQEELHTIAAQWLSKLSDIKKIPEQ